MAREFSRASRVGQQLQRELALILQREIRDSRLGMVTINEVEVSRDMGYAKVYVTFLETEEGKVKEQMTALTEVAPYVRHLIGQRVRMRVTPEIRFTYDKSLVEGIRMSNLVTSVRSSDKTRAEQAGRDVDATDEEDKG